MLGVIRVCGGSVAKASVSFNPIAVPAIIQNQDNSEASVLVKVLSSQYQAYAVTLALTNGDASTAKISK